jgi:hypothetical protein
MKRQRMMLAVTAVVALLFVLTLGAPRAFADMTEVHSIINTGDAGLNGVAPPYAEVFVTVTNGVATVEFLSLNSNYFMGDSHAVDLNLTQSGITASHFVWAGGDSSTAFTNTGSKQVDGFGIFNLTIDNADGRNSAVSELTFTLSGTWANASSVLALNGVGGWDAATHIYAPGGITGYAAEGGTPIVPDGGMTLMLLGGALVGLATLGRRFRV